MNETESLREKKEELNVYDRLCFQPISITD